MPRANVLSGQVYGKLDWVTSDGREVGMFLKTSERVTTRVVLRGPEVERMLANGLLQKGMMVTGHGDMSARCMQRKDDGSWMAEVLCDASRIAAETAREGRTRGAIYANLKGVALHWDSNTMQLKTFMNPGDQGRREKFTISLHMVPWINGMTADGQERFKAMMRTGREFTASAIVEVNCYRTREGEQVPLLLLLPTDFRLQG